MRLKEAVSGTRLLSTIPWMRCRKGSARARDRRFDANALGLSFSGDSPINITQGFRMHDLLIRGAEVFDGLVNPPKQVNIAVDAGRVSVIGKTTSGARQAIDAGGLALMPGIVDLHTHYDAQITWDRTMSPSPAVEASGQLGHAIRRRCAPSLHVRCRFRLAFPRALGASDRAIYLAGRDSRTDERPCPPLPGSRTRPLGGRRSGRHAAVRPCCGWHFEGTVRAGARAWCARHAASMGYGSMVRRSMKARLCRTRTRPRGCA